MVIWAFLIFSFAKRSKRGKRAVNFFPLMSKARQCLFAASQETFRSITRGLLKNSDLSDGMRNNVLAFDDKDRCQLVCVCVCTCVCVFGCVIVLKCVCLCLRLKGFCWKIALSARETDSEGLRWQNHSENHFSAKSSLNWWFTLKLLLHRSPLRTEIFHQSEGQCDFFQ